MPDPGLGREHRRDRALLVAAMANDGTDACGRCGYAMWATPQLAIAAGFPPWMGRPERDHVISRVLGGADGPAVLSHAKCNRAAGARLGNRLRGIRKAAGLPAVKSGRPAASRCERW